MTDQDKARAVLAKPLFWRKGTEHPQDGDAEWIADGISGRYSASKQRDGTWLLWWAHDNFIWEKCATFAECKAKAEADWQQRFRDRLAATPASPCSVENGGFLGPQLSAKAQEAIAEASLATPAQAEGQRYLIRKGGAYYRPNAEGYTRHRSEAGRYTLAEAISHSHPNGPDGPRDGIDYVLDDAPASQAEGQTAGSGALRSELRDRLALIAEARTESGQVEPYLITLAYWVEANDRAILAALAPEDAPRGEAIPEVPQWDSEHTDCDGPAGGGKFAHPALITPKQPAAGDARPYPDLLSSDEQKDLLTRAEHLWADLQANNIGGFSGINRPFYIVNEFRRVIEAFGRRDTGLHWSKDDLDVATPPSEATPDEREALALAFDAGWTAGRIGSDDYAIKKQLRDDYLAKASPASEGRA